MLKSTLLLVLSVFLGHHHFQVAAGQKQVHFIHPTFDRAVYLPIKPNEFTGILKTTGVAVYANKNQTLEYQPPSNGSHAQHDRTRSVEYLLRKFNDNVIDDYEARPIFYKDDIEPLRDTLQNYESQESKACPKYVFRAYDVVPLPFPKPEKLFALGIDQGHSSCKIYYRNHTTDPGKVVNGDREGTIDPRTVPKTFYKISSVWAEPGSDTDHSFFNATLIDEAGYLYRISVYYQQGQLSGKQVESLTSVHLDGFTFGEKPFESQAIKREIEKVSGGKGLENMRRHFSHSFVEAIALFDDTLVYSRGLFVPNQRALLVVGPQQTRLPMFSQLLDQDIVNVTVVALEMYKYKSKYIMHMGTLEADERIKDHRYYYCELDDISRMEGRKLDDDFNQDGNPCQSGSLVLGVLPIDIVYMEKCAKTALFYQHAYQLFDPDQSMAATDKSQPPFKVIEWMTFPLNAILFHNNRLYLFNSGNELFISKELSITANDCRLDNVEMEEGAFYQSELLLTFKHYFQPEEQGSSRALPVYDSRRHKFDGEKWTPPLDKMNLVKEDLLIKPKNVPVPPTLATSPSPSSTSTSITTSTAESTPPGPTKTTPKPNDDPSTAMIIVGIIIVVIVILALGSIYYFCFGDANKPGLRGAKSALRKQKQVVGQVQGAKRESQIDSAPTVRSSLASRTAGASPSSLSQGAKQASKSKTKSPIRSPTSAIGTAIKSVVKSTKTPVSGAKSVRSPGSRKTTRIKSRAGSKSPGTQLGKAKTKSSIKSKHESSPLGGIKTISSAKKV